MKKIKILFPIFGVLFLCCCSEDYAPIIPLDPVEKQRADSALMKRTETAFENVYNKYWSEKVELFFSSYPNEKGTPQEPTTPKYENHAFSWGFGGLLSAYSAIVKHTVNVDFRMKYESSFKKSLEQYYSTKNNIPGLACFVNNHDDRLYDDAIWIGIDLIDMYETTNNDWYLDYAKIVWSFVLSGKDDVLGGGIYWAENSKDSKNTCSNAPAVVFALKLYKVTAEQMYLDTGIEIYDWTKNTLQDPSDYLYWDNQKTNGTIETGKFSYNSGQMIQAGVLLYKATDDEQYLDDAKLVAQASYEYFFRNFVSGHSGEQFRIINDGHIWFNAIMVRGFIELNNVEKSAVYMTAIKKSIEHAWKYVVDTETGLLNANLSGVSYGNPGEINDILLQGAFLEMSAKIAAIE